MSLAAGVTSFSFALLMAGDVVGNGAYETSLYDAYPQVFWLLLGITLFLGLFSAYLGLMGSDAPRGWMGGFLLLIGVNGLALLLPLLRDYAFKSSYDELTHFSYALTVIQRGHYDQADFYPASHVLVAVFSDLSGLDLHVVLSLFPLLFYLVFLGNIAFLARVVESRPQVRAVMMLFATPLPYYFFGSMFYPTHFAVCMLPLVLSFLLASRSAGAGMRRTLPLLFLLFFLPFLHPWAVLASAALMCSFSLGDMITTARRGSCASRMRRSSRGYLVPLAIVMIAWLSWFMSFSVFGVAFRRIARSFLEGLSGPDSLSRYLELAQRAHLGLGRAAAIFLHTYGASLIMLAIAGVVVIWTAHRLVRRKRDVPSLVASLSLFAVLFTGLAAISWFRDLVSGNPLRFANFAVVAVPGLLTALDFGAAQPRERASNSHRWVSIRMPVLMVLLLLSSVLGILGLYPSPFTGQANLAVSYAAEAGVRFLVENVRALSGRVYTPLGLVALPAAVMNSEEVTELRMSQPGWCIKRAPGHFGYSSGVGGIEEFVDPAYLILTPYERNYYTEVWPGRGQFTTEDFARLEDDSRWNKPYSSGDLAIFQWR